MLRARVISAVVLLVPVMAAVYLGGPWIVLLALIIGIAAMIEYLRLARHVCPTSQKDIAPQYAIGLAMVFVWVADGRWNWMQLASWGTLLVALVGLAAQVFRGNAPQSLTSWALTIAGGLYIGGGASYIVRLRLIDMGLEWLIIAMVSTWICDSGAYFVGSKWGRHRFFPAISPKKSVEGALGGLVTGVLSVMIMARLMVGVALGWGALLGVAVVLAATFGDLAESVIKRQAGVKDSSNLIPGHGGALDRVDSLLFVIPTVYVAVMLVSRLAIG